MQKIVLLRHGESVWNKENLFTGWTDVELSEKGIEEARQAGKILKKSGFDFDIAYTSLLNRAIKTLWIVLEEMNLMWIPEIKTWRLNERHYGALQGLNKRRMAEKVGAEQVHIWRRSYDVRPPALEDDDDRNPLHEAKYSNLSPKIIPRTESLKDTCDRVMPFWHDTIVPAMRKGRKPIVSAHGNSLRALVKYLNNISDEDIPNLNIPTGKPLIFEFDDDMNTRNHYYLSDEVEAEI